MTKILLTGSNGLVGQKLYHLARTIPAYSLLPTFRSEPLFDTRDGAWEQLDVSDHQRVHRLIADYQPDVVVHLAALSQPDQCEMNHAESEKINYHSVKNLAWLSEKYHFHLVFLSSDFVFAGDRGHYSETDIPLPVCAYGHHKFNAEKHLMNSCRSHTIIRTSLVYGYSPQLVRSNLFTKVAGSLSISQPLQIVTDQFRSPTLAEDLANGILSCITRVRKGIYHLAGKDFLSVYDFAVRIARHLGYDTSLIQPVKTERLNEPARRPPVTGLDISKARKDLDYNPGSLQEGIRIVAEQIKQRPNFSGGDAFN